jgi:hypothetical protein
LLEWLRTSLSLSLARAPPGKAELERSFLTSHLLGKPTS